MVKLDVESAVSKVFWENTFCVRAK